MLTVNQLVDDLDRNLKAFSAGNTNTRQDIEKITSLLVQAKIIKLSDRYNILNFIADK